MSDVIEGVDLDRLTVLDNMYESLTNKLAGYNHKKRDIGARIKELMDRNVTLSSEERVTLQLLQLDCARINSQAKPIKDQYRDVEKERAELHRRRLALGRSSTSSNAFVTRQDVATRILHLPSEYPGQNYGKPLGHLLDAFATVIRKMEADAQSVQRQQLEQECKRLQAEVMRLSTLVNTLSIPKPPLALRLLSKLWQRRIRETDPVKQTQGYLYRLQIDDDLESEIKMIVGDT